jgi:hypothetical protein
MLVGLAASAASAAAAPVALRAGRVTYLVEPATLKIDARPDGAAPLAVMPPLHAPEPAAVTPDGAGWRWTDAEGRQVSLSTEGEALRLVITGAKGSKPRLAAAAGDDRNLADPRRRRPGLQGR